MNIGLLTPGFSADSHDYAIPVMENLVRELGRCENVRVLALRYPHHRNPYRLNGASIFPLGAGQIKGWRRLALWRDALWTLRRLHNALPFDVLHALWADETGLVAAWAGRILGIPVVVNISGGELVYLRNIGYGLQRGVFSRWIVWQALKGASRVITGCRYTRNLISQADYSVPPDRLQSITMGIDPDVFFFQDRPRKPRHLVHVASMIPVKDQATLLRAVSRLGDVTLDMIGDGPERASLEILAGKLQIADRVRFLGRIHHRQLPDYYRQAELHVLSSQHEALGMVTLEAAACGVPTVSTEVGLLPDCPEIGITVPTNDDVALAAAIDELLVNHQKRNDLEQSAQEIVRSQFTIQHTADQLRELYQQLQS